MESNFKRIAVRVHGKVQGVFFRSSTQEKAEALGLKGFVQNEDDGTVYLEAEGDTEDLDQLKHWLHIGPTRARVDKVEVHELNKSGEFKNFEVRR